MKIRNINGTSDNQCQCGSWLNHWRKFSGQTMEYCPVMQCLKKDLAGAHVQTADTNDDHWYIIPLCMSHNFEIGGTPAVSDQYRLVSANVSETCGKKS